MKIKFNSSIFFLSLFAIIVTILILLYFHLKIKSSSVPKENPEDSLETSSPNINSKEIPFETESPPDTNIIKLSSLNTTKPTSEFVYTLHTLPNGKIIQEKKGTYISIAPNNSILDFLKSISTLFTLVDLSGVEKLPLNFSWKEKSDISKVFNQYNCGCCWSIGVTQAINDSFVCGSQPLLDKNPNISPQVLISCYKSGQCKGGNPLNTLKWIEKNGISVKDVHYNWCRDSKKCTTKYKSCKKLIEKNGISKGLHLCVKKYGKDNIPEPGILEELNDIIPICPSKKSSLKYYIKKIHHPHIRKDDPDIDIKVKKLQLNVKKHIFNYGPVVGGFMVYKSMKYGNFLSEGNSKAIYFDKYDYKKNIYNNQIKSSDAEGLHTISIVGWGVDENIDGKFIGKEKGTKHKVGYWIVRNSWGEKWGIDGYLHLAMYPFNKHCQLEVSIPIIGNNKTSYQGGFILFTPTLTPTYPTSVENFELENNDTINNYYYFIILLLIIIILYTIFYF